MKVKTRELKSGALDWAVGKAEGKDIRTPNVPPMLRIYLLATVENEEVAYHPSSSWAQGGPIIEREIICVYEMPGHVGGKFRAEKRQDVLPPGVNGVYYAAGDEYLETAMCCYVASKLGDEVDIPDELVEVS